MTPRQLALALPHRVAQARDDFLVTPSNANAIALIDQWPNWSSYACVIVGPPGSGKSHLCAVFSAMTGGLVFDAPKLDHETVIQLNYSHGHAFEMGHGTELDEKAMFHALNLARTSSVPHLLTALSLPTRWSIALPDLRSRLDALPVVQIGAPDDELLRGVLLKHFADRQLVLSETVLNYLLLRMPRGLDDVGKIVDAIDRRALEEKTPISKALVAKILSDTYEPDVAS